MPCLLTALTLSSASTIQYPSPKTTTLASLITTEQHTPQTEIMGNEHGEYHSKV